MLKIKQFIPGEFCLSCAGCCRFSQQETPWQPQLLNQEVGALLKKKVPPALISPTKNIRLLPCPKPDNPKSPLRPWAAFVCSLFNLKENKCKIYSFRPFECQLYPFLIRGQGKKVFLAVDLRCPFISQRIRDKGSQEYTQYLIKFLRHPRITAILKNNPQITQEYAEVLNLAELKL